MSTSWYHSENTWSHFAINNFRTIVINQTKLDHNTAHLFLLSSWLYFVIIPTHFNYYNYILDIFWLSQPAICYSFLKIKSVISNPKLLVHVRGDFLGVIKKHMSRQSKYCIMMTLSSKLGKGTFTNNKTKLCSQIVMRGINISPLACFPIYLLVRKTGDFLWRKYNIIYTKLNYVAFNPLYILNWDVKIYGCN